MSTMLFRNHDLSIVMIIQHRKSSSLKLKPQIAMPS